MSTCVVSVWVLRRVVLTMVFSSCFRCKQLGLCPTTCDVELGMQIVLMVALCSLLFQGALEHILMDGDVSGAVDFVCDKIQRLLSGDYGIWHFIMTGGLWRVTGTQVPRLLEWSRSHCFSGRPVHMQQMLPVLLSIHEGERLLVHLSTFIGFQCACNTCILCSCASTIAVHVAT